MNNNSSTNTAGLAIYIPFGTFARFHDIDKKFRKRVFRHDTPVIKSPAFTIMLAPESEQKFQLVVADTQGWEMTYTSLDKTHRRERGWVWETGILHMWWINKDKNGLREDPVHDQELFFKVQCDTSGDDPLDLPWGWQCEHMKDQSVDSGMMELYDWHLPGFD
tara:strand:+ start:3252 stop:3740 length:489 start_codon:yes stop_codon:yes gene_type:complete